MANFSLDMANFSPGTLDIFVGWCLIWKKIMQSYKKNDFSVVTMMV
jgi:hypothetical protein